MVRIASIGNDVQLDSRSKMKNNLLFRVNDVIPWHVSLLSAVQLVIGNIGVFLSMAYITTNALCPGEEDSLMPEFISILLISGGIASMVSLLCGSRLPVVLLPSFVFALTIPSSLSASHWACPVNGSRINRGLIFNNSSHHFQQELVPEPWKVRVNALSGGLIVGSLIQIVLGASGMLGILLQVIGPLTFIPVLLMVGMSIVQSLIPAFSEQWGIALLTCGLIVLFSHILANISIPLPSYDVRGGCGTTRYPVFQLFPHFLACGTSWLLSYILTLTGVFASPANSKGHLAQTDAKQNLLYDAPWLIVPYPGRWGMPTFSGDLVIVMVMSVFCNLLQSFGSYHLTANCCGCPPPPPYVLNRALTMEGLTNLFSGLLGSPVGLCTVPSQTIFITATKNGSRSPRYVAAVMLILIGCVGKFSAGLSLMPDPIIGGMSAFILSVIISVAMSGLRDVDMKSSRNLTVLGFTIFMALILPQSIREIGPLVHTGHDVTDVILQAVMSNAMIVAAITGFVLDNLLPGSRLERGLVKPGNEKISPSLTKSEEADLVYNLPCTRFQRYVEKPQCHILPICPPYDLDPCACRSRCGTYKDNVANTPSYDHDTHL